MEYPVTASKLSTRKQAIARHFAHASQYDNYAHIQQHVCDQLIHRIARQQHDSVLEVGAGTGQLTQRLAAQVKSARWSINELSERQAEHLQAMLPQAKILIGDAETMALGNGHSLIISANAIQWFDDPLSFIAQSASVMDALSTKRIRDVLAGTVGGLIGSA